MAADVCPPAGASLPDVFWPLASTALLLAGSAAMFSAQALLARGLRAPVWALVLLAVVYVLAAFGMDGWGQQLAGLRPTANAWSATVAAMLAWQGFDSAVLLIMGLHVCARPERPTAERCTGIAGQHGAALALRHRAGLGWHRHHLPDAAVLRVFFAASPCMT